MKIKNIFVVTPLGEEGSPERIHAGRMNENIFKPLEEEFECSIKNALNHPAINSVAGGIFKAIKEADVVIADMTFGRLNVIYEIGLAHALKKLVILISPNDFSVPSDFNGLYCIKFDKTGIQNDHNVIENLKNELKKSFQAIENANEDERLLYLPYSHFMGENIYEILSGIDSKIDNLKEVMGKDKVTTEYIEGETNAFNALTDAIRVARDSVQTTRFSPYAVAERRPEFYQTIKIALDEDARKVFVEANSHALNNFQRIFAMNNEKKLEEIKGLVDANKGRDFTVFLTEHEYNFEIVIVDMETVFIHFRKTKGKNEKLEEIITATLKVSNRTVAKEFKEIFDTIAKNSQAYNCKDINIDNLAEKIAEIEARFKVGLKNYKNQHLKSGNATKE